MFSKRTNRISSLIISMATVTFVWLVVLPAVARWQPVAKHIDRMQEKNIAVDAMFYTELNRPTPPGWTAWK